MADERLGVSNRLRRLSLGELDQKLRVRVYRCTSPMDMRKGFGTLAVLVWDGLGYDPLSGHLFLFVGQRRDRLKILYWDRDGYALWYKRLERGTFRMPAARPDAASVELKASALLMLLDGIDRPSIQRRRRLDGLPARGTPGPPPTDPALSSHATNRCCTERSVLTLRVHRTLTGFPQDSRKKTLKTPGLAR